ncbi:hypothetical protein Saro_3984 (plasmid) [Novosphingobium aromaticivorans DSM 12444]|uniref:Uncharacterized protein n=3 Tax=Sphingomonadaceae TaxID=41297 RepID=A0A7Y0GBU2_9SPHN|nr:MULTISPECIES: hypothetical protein [Sphingomonadaceae]ABP64226.1 hypothetical protein Saro_3984 [Novosphingobium aromaticivorans DSM 12444]AYO76083.1 hypothetical protein EBF16_03615 [Sphingobium yanoikuyae]NML94987.1 hypothetical protein [Novosphingobium olei]SCY85403.1 hypothetical protein SAMN05660666_03249 [Novosphingobium aromaticivorans]
MRARFAFSPDAAGRVFDRAQATLVWLAVLVFLSSEPAVRGLAIAAMLAVALAATVVALLAEAAPSLPQSPTPPPAAHPGD